MPSSRRSFAWLLVAALALASPLALAQDANDTVDGAEAPEEVTGGAWWLTPTGLLVAVVVAVALVGLVVAAAARN